MARPTSAEHAEEIRQARFRDLERANHRIARLREMIRKAQDEIAYLEAGNAEIEAAMAAERSGGEG